MLSPLFKWAVLSGSQPTVRFHIQRGVDINSKDGDGRSPLMLAALKGNIEVCRLLLEAGADPEIQDIVRLCLTGSHFLCRPSFSRLPERDHASPAGQF